MLAEFTRLAGRSYEETYQLQLEKFADRLVQLKVTLKGRNAALAVEPTFVRDLREEVHNARRESDKKRE